jgi:hypothetical protein
MSSQKCQQHYFGSLYNATTDRNNLIGCCTAHGPKACTAVVAGIFVLTLQNGNTPKALFTLTKCHLRMPMTGAELS